MPKVPTYDTNAPIGGASGRLLSDTPSVAPATGLSGFKSAAAPRAAQIDQTSPNIQGGNDQSGKIEAQQLGAAADAVNKVGNSVQDIVLKMQEDANRTMVKGASIKMRQQAMRLQMGSGDPMNPTDPNRVTGFLEIKGADAVIPKDGKPLTSAYLEKFEEQRQSIRDGLKNDAQRRAFDADSEELKLGFETQAVKHTIDQYHVVQTDTAKAAIEQSADIMALTPPDDVEGYERARTELVQNVADLARINGTHADIVALAQKDALGKVGQQIIDQRLAKNDLTGAQLYRETYAADFTAAERVKIDAAIKVKSQADVAWSVAEQAVGLRGGPQVDGDSAPVAVGATPRPVGARYTVIEKDIKAAGGKAHDVAYGLRLSQVESPSDTANNGSSYGRFQYQPATFRGIMPNGDPKNPIHQTQAMIIMSNRDRATLRKAGVKDDDANTYIMHQQGAGGGKALLTAPPEVGAVAALEGAGVGAGRALDSIAGNIGMRFSTPDQKAKAREVARNMSSGQFVNLWRERWSEGAPGDRRTPSAMPSKPQTLEEAVTRGLALLPPNADAETRRNTIANISSLYSIQERSERETESNALNAAYAWLENNGGRYDAMPQSLKMAVPASQWDTLRNQGHRIGTGETRVTDPATLMDLTNPATLTAGTDAEFRAKYLPLLSKGDFEQFARERGNLKNPTPTAGNGPQDLNREAFNDALRAGFTGLEIPTTKSEKGYDAAKVGSLTKFAQDRLFAAQHQAGRKFTDAETTAFVNDLFNKNVPFQKHIGLTWRGQPIAVGKPGQTNIMTVEADDIPANERAAVVAQLKKNKVANPTEDQILYAWRVAHTN